MAGKVGIEPTTGRLTAVCSAAELHANMFGGRSWIRTNNVYLSEQIYSLPQHHRRCRPSVYGVLKVRIELTTHRLQGDCSTY